MLKIFQEEFNQISQHYGRLLNFYGAWSASYDKGRLSHSTQPWFCRSLWHFIFRYAQKSPQLLLISNLGIMIKIEVAIYEPEAEEGDIVIIPQHIVHFTRPNPVSFKKRIISFDFKL